MIKSTLRVMLARREMTLKDLQQLTGLRPATLSKIHTGKIDRYPMYMMDAICKALECQPGDILEYIPDEPDERG